MRRLPPPFRNALGIRTPHAHDDDADGDDADGSITPRILLPIAAVCLWWCSARGDRAEHTRYLSRSLSQKVHALSTSSFFLRAR